MKVIVKLGEKFVYVYFLSVFVVAFTIDLPFWR